MAVVTGGANGMGIDHCLELARRGASVGIADVDRDGAERVVAQVAELGREALAVDCDVSDAASVEAGVAAVAERYGRIDIVVSNAGVKDKRHGIAETLDEDWRRQFAVHVDGAFHLCRASVPWLRRSPAGRIVLVSSEWGQVGQGIAHGYCAAKGALLAFGRNLAVELGPEGILVNTIAPGSVYTRMTDADPPEVVQRAIDSTRIGRLAEPREIAYLVAFLASDEAAFITGQTLPINGGSVIAGY